MPPVPCITSCAMHHLLAASRLGGMLGVCAAVIPAAACLLDCLQCRCQQHAAPSLQAARRCISPPVDSCYTAHLQVHLPMVYDARLPIQQVAMRPVLRPCAASSGQQWVALRCGSRVLLLHLVQEEQGSRWAAAGGALLCLLCAACCVYPALALSPAGDPVVQMHQVASSACCQRGHRFRSCWRRIGLPANPLFHAGWQPEIV